LQRIFVLQRLKLGTRQFVGAFFPAGLRLILRLLAPLNLLQRPSLLVPALDFPVELHGGPLLNRAGQGNVDTRQIAFLLPLLVNVLETLGLLVAVEGQTLVAAPGQGLAPPRPVVLLLLDAAVVLERRHQTLPRALEPGLPLVL